MHYGIYEMDLLFYVDVITYPCSSLNACLANPS